jgi:hypothetical protein
LYAEFPTDLRKELYQAFAAQADAENGSDDDLFTGELRDEIRSRTKRGSKDKKRAIRTDGNEGSTNDGANVEPAEPPKKKRRVVGNRAEGDEGAPTQEAEGKAKPKVKAKKAGPNATDGRNVDGPSKLRKRKVEPNATDGNDDDGPKTRKRKATTSAKAGPALLRQTSDATETAPRRSKQKPASSTGGGLPAGPPP